MNIELLKQKIQNRKFLGPSLVILVVIVLILYLKYFFTIGVFFDDTFLKKQGKYPNIQYVGKTSQGSIQISVDVLNKEQNNIDVTFKLPNNINKQYNVRFKDSSVWGLSDIVVEDYSDNVIFEGQYNESISFLFDKYGVPSTDNKTTMVRANEKVTYNENYEVSLKEVADFAAFANKTTRGKLGYLVIAMLIFTLTLIDIKYPLLFFKLNHMFHVKDPEPSDFYISMQQMSWVIMPIVGLAFLIAAVI